MTKDLSKIVEQLLPQDIYSPTTTKIHSSFANLKKNLVKKKLKNGSLKGFHRICSKHKLNYQILLIKFCSIKLGIINY